MSALGTQLKQQQERFERREPRAEDVSTIDALKKALREKDELVRARPRPPLGARGLGISAVGACRCARRTRR